MPAEPTDPTSQTGPLALPTFYLGQLQIAAARNAAERLKALALRAVIFRGDRAKQDDQDAFDPHCLHLMVSVRGTEELLATARLRLLDGRAAIETSYSAQFYDLSPLARERRRLLEIGRLCLRPDHRANPDILRALLAGIARAAHSSGAQLLIGCTSFPGADPREHAPALSHLARDHLGPAHLRPGRRSGRIVDLVSLASEMQPEAADMPGLLRLYLGLGAWVSDHAVRDLDLDTLHVFTAVDLSTLPSRRVRLLSGLSRQ